MAQLGRFTHTAASSTTGLPASGAAVTIYREGATVNGAQSGTSPLAVTVLDLGKIKAGDTVFVNTTTGTTYNVNSTSGRTSLTLGGFAGTLSLSGNDRLIPVGSKPTLYTDDQASVSTSNPLSTSSTGLASCFIEFGAYDYIVSGGGLTTTLFQGMVSGSEAPGQIRYADDFAANSSTEGIQEAVDDLPSTGGVVQLSAKTYSTSACVWLHTGVHLTGSGSGNTIIKRATGSITDADANASGPVINCGPKGSNGTQFSSGSIGSNITLSNVILDGNYSNFTLTNTNLGLQGIRCLWVDGVMMNNVKVQNTLQGGFYFSNTRGLSLSNLQVDTVGQWSVVSERNGINFLNNDNSSTYTNQGTLTGFTGKTIGYDSATLSGEAITLAGCQNLDISGVSIDGCDFAVEFTSASSVAIQDLTFNGMTVRNMRDWGITFNATAADVARVQFDNITFHCHSTLHDAGILYMSSSGHSMTDVHYTNITATNINVADTTSRAWIDMQPATGKTRNRMYFTNLTFTGQASLVSTRTGDVAITIRTSDSSAGITDMFFSNCLFRNISGTGIFIDDNLAGTASNLHFSHVVVDNANHFGTIIRNNAVAATLKEIYFDHCVMKDCAIQNAAGARAGFKLEAAFAGSSINNIYFKNCRSFKTAGATHLYGVDLVQSAGTLDKIYFSDCDFSGTQTAWFIAAGTMTSIQHKAPAIRGTDIASAATIAIPPDGDVFHVTGNTNVTNGITVDAWDNGRLIVLIFDSTPTISDTGTSVLSGDFVATASDTLTLKCDGTNWYEIGEEAN